MDLQAELAAKLGVTPAAPVGEGSEFESSNAPSESVSNVEDEKNGNNKKKHKDRRLTDDFEKKCFKIQRYTLYALQVV